jgi:hypothetical protein
MGWATEEWGFDPRRVQQIFNVSRDQVWGLLRLLLDIKAAGA